MTQVEERMRKQFFLQEDNYQIYRHRYEMATIMIIAHCKGKITLEMSEKHACYVFLICVASGAELRNAAANVSAEQVRSMRACAATATTQQACSYEIS